MEKDEIVAEEVDERGSTTKLDRAVEDAILNQPALARVIERGLEDSRAGRTVSNVEAKRRIDRFLP